MPSYQLADYVQLLVSGASTGCIYVLIALGLITIYNVTQVVNLAQGEFLMLGAMLAITLHQAGMPVAIAGSLSVLAVMAIGALVQRLTLRPARGAPEVTLVMITVGTAITLRGLALLFWGTTPYGLPEFSPGAPLEVAGAIISRQRLWVAGTAAVLLLLLYAFFEGTLLGKAVRACAINRQTAMLAGVNAERVAMLVYAISAGMSAAAGIVVAPLTLATYDMGLTLGLKGFVAAIMGGMVSVPAAVAGGILLGILESFASGFFSSGIRDGVAFVVLFVVLFARTVDLRRLVGRAS